MAGMLTRLLHLMCGGVLVQGDLQGLCELVPVFKALNLSDFQLSLLSGLHLLEALDEVIRALESGLLKQQIPDL